MTEAPDTFDVLCDEVRAVRRRRRRPRTVPPLGLDPRLVPEAPLPRVGPTAIADDRGSWPEPERGFLVRPVHFLIPVANYLISAGLMVMAYPFIDHIIGVMLDAAMVRSAFVFKFILGRVQMASPWIAGVISVVGWLAIGGMVARSYRNGRLYPAERLPAGFLPPRPLHPLETCFVYLVAAAMVGLGYWATYDFVAGGLLVLLAATMFFMAFTVALVWVRCVTLILAIIVWFILGDFLARRYALFWTRLRPRPRRDG